MISIGSKNTIENKEDKNEPSNQPNISQSLKGYEKKNDVFRFRLFPKFDEYRKKKVFIDCKFTTSNGEIYAHRIILARFSKIFFNYFSRKFGNNDIILDVPIPFNINSLFPQMIDFFYKEKIDNDSILEDPIPLYIMAIVYDVPLLSLILDDITNESLSVSNVLDYAMNFKNVHLSSTSSQIFPGITDSFQRMIDRSLQFAPLIAEHFKQFPLKSLYKSLSPQLLAEVLIKTGYEDRERISIIDGYVSQYGYLKEEDRVCLQKVIDWKSSNSYQLFVDHEANWVSPSIAIEPISAILENRRKTINSMIDFVTKIDKQSNHWYLMQWISSIKNSDGDDQIKECNLLDFTSTIGGSISNPINPTLYRFIRTKASKALQMPQYRELLFDRECYADKTNEYFLSFPFVDETQKQFIGYEFEEPCYIPKQIIYQPVEKKAYPLTVVGKAFDNDGNEVYCSPLISVKNSHDEVIIDLDITIPIKSVVMEMVGNNSNDVNILRALRFNVIGYFVPS